MANIAKVEVPWGGGGVVGGGLSVFYVDPSLLGTIGFIRTFFDAIKGFFPTDVTWNFPSSGDLVEEQDGSITGSWSSSTYAAVTGTVGTQPVMGVGGRIEWLTGAVYGGRRRRGRTFLVPLATNQFAGEGMLVDASVASIKAAGDALVSSAAGGLLVWTRPTSTLVGAAHGVTDCVVPDQVSWLRGRRT